MVSFLVAPDEAIKADEAKEVRSTCQINLSPVYNFKITNDNLCFDVVGN